MYDVYLYFYDVIYKLQYFYDESYLPKNKKGIPRRIAISPKAKKYSDKESYLPNKLAQRINEFIILQL